MVSRRIALVAFLALFVPLAALAVEPAPRDFAPVQDGPTTDAETVLPWAPDRVVVKFRADAYERSSLAEVEGQKSATITRTALPSLDAALASVGASGLRAMITAPLPDKALAAGTGAGLWYICDLHPGADVESAVATLAADPNLESALPDLRAFPAVVPNDPQYASNWGHDNTAQLPAYGWGTTWDHTGPGVGTVGFDANADVAWNGVQVYGSSSVVIAILDSGVDTAHADLNLVAGYDHGSNDSNPMDDSGQPGHGTACAGVAAAVANNGTGVVGVAGGCSIMPMKVADNNGDMYFSAITNAVYWAANNGADIISMSFGAAATSYSPLDTAISYAVGQGVTLLAATGNENAGTISYPAYNPDVIGVGAASPCGERKRSSSNSSEVNPGVSTDPNGYTCDGERWWGSNYGLNSQDHQGAVDVIAPTILPTTDISGSAGYQSGDYEPFFNGTSCATPYAAGVCALILSANPSFTPAQVRNQLVTTAQDVVGVESVSGWDRYTGYGMVDAAAAVGGTPAAPVAAFAPSVTSGCAPLTVNFTDQSTGLITFYSWSFGDGGVSTIPNPSHIYNTPGTYTVSLTVTGPGGSDTLTMPALITADGAPTASFSAAPLVITVGETVTFTDASTGNPIAYSWDFGDGGTSTLQNPTHTYTVPGLYPVQLIAANLCGSDLLVVPDMITVNPPPPPVAAFTQSATDGCPGLTVDFTDQSTGLYDTWEWNFGDGGMSNEPNPSYVYLAPGTFDVTLTVTGPGGSDALTKTGLVTIGEDVAAGFTAAPTTVAVGGSVTFTDTSVGADSWSWTFGDGGSSSVQNPTYSYAAAGTYTVTLTAAGTCGSDVFTATDLITVVAPQITAEVYPLQSLPGAVSLVVKPDGTGDPLTQAQYWDGVAGNSPTTVDATIGVRLTDEFGDPVVGHAAADITIQSQSGGWVNCGTAILTADAPTDANGETTISGSPAAGGHSGAGELLLVSVDAPVPVATTYPGGAAGLDYRFNSADVNADLDANLSDVSAFAAIYFAASYDYGGDFLWDGAVNLSDVTALAGGLGAKCPAAAKSAVAAVATSTGLGVHFDEAGTRAAATAEPDQRLDAYVTLDARAFDGPVSAFDFRLRTSDNVVVHERAIVGDGLNVAGGDDWVVGLAAPGAASGVIPLVRLSVSVTDGNPARFWLEPSSLSGLELPAVVHDGQLVAVRPVSGGTNAPVATLNDKDFALGGEVPAAVGLELGIAPNPFNPQTEIRFGLPRAGEVQLRVFDAAGKLVTTLIDGTMGSGEHVAVWTGTDRSGRSVASGVYFASLRTADGVLLEKMLLMK